MVHREALRKVPGGKTVKVEASINEGRIEKVMISGDFFAYPPSIIEELELELAGKPAEIDAVRRILDEFKGKGILVGISFEDIEQLFAQILCNTR